MKISLLKIGEILQGTVIGNPLYEITGVASFEEAQERQITFLDNPKFLKNICSSKAGAILISSNHNEHTGNIIKVENPRLAFAKLLELFHPREQIKPGISARSFIDESALLKAGVRVEPFACIGRNVRVGRNSIISCGTVLKSNVVIGNNVVIYPNVTIMGNCKVGNNVIIHPGSVIGADGFGFTVDKKKKDSYYYKIPHVGIVQIDDNVEIGTCNTIDRATIGKTWIKSGVKTDNMVHIGHNVTIGKNTLIISNTAIAGSVSVGDDVIIAGKVGIADHVNIGDNVIIGPRSGIVKDVPKGKILSGSPAMPHKQWLRVQRDLPSLPNMIKKIRKLEKKIESLALKLTFESNSKIIV